MGKSQAHNPGVNLASFTPLLAMLPIEYTWIWMNSLLAGLGMEPEEPFILWHMVCKDCAADWNNKQKHCLAFMPGLARASHQFALLLKVLLIFWSATSCQLSASTQPHGTNLSVIHQRTETPASFPSITARIWRWAASADSRSICWWAWPQRPQHFWSGLIGSDGHAFCTAALF